jgi:hypothetical protein
MTTYTITANADQSALHRRDYRQRWYPSARARLCQRIAGLPVPSGWPGLGRRRTCSDGRHSSDTKERAPLGEGAPQGGIDREREEPAAQRYNPGSRRRQLGIYSDCVSYVETVREPPCGDDPT